MYALVEIYTDKHSYIRTHSHTNKHTAAVALATAELTQRAEATHQEATYPEPEDAHPRKVAELEQATSSAREGVDHLNAQLAELEQQRNAVRESMSHLVEKEKELINLVELLEPANRSKLSLYVNSTKIVWDFVQRERVVGEVSDPDEGILERFDLGMEPVTFETVNALWDIINGKSGQVGGLAATMMTPGPKS